MRKHLFDIPLYQYEVNNWSYKKKLLYEILNRQNFLRSREQFFDCDRDTNNNSYDDDIANIFSPQLNHFCEKEKVSCNITDVWSVKYKKGDYQNIHNHRSIGYFGILYFQFDPQVHQSTFFMCPWQDPKNDTTYYKNVNVKEGTLLIVPSFIHHFVKPSESDKERIIISFDLLPIK